MKPEQSAQDLLWYVPAMLGHGWWYICSAMALASALTWFLYLIMNERMSPLLVARMTICFGMVAFALVPLNSGWLPWGVMITTSGVFYSGFLIATNWCHRVDKWASLRGLFTGYKRPTT